MAEPDVCPFQRPAPITIGELLAEPGHEQARARDGRSWASMPDIDVSLVALSHEAGRSVLAGQNIIVDLPGEMATMLRQNPSVDPEVIALYENWPRTFLGANGDDHRRARALFSRALSPRRLSPRLPAIAAHAHELARALEPGDDFIESFAAPYPGSVLCDVIGFPMDDRDHLRSLIDTTQRSLDRLTVLTMSHAESLELLHAERALFGYTTNLIAERRRNPGDDLISHVVNDDECTVPDDIIASSISGLIFGGLDTAQCVLGAMMLFMAEHPEVWERIADDPELVGPAVEELLRWQGPVAAVGRQADGDWTSGDVDATAGDAIAVSIWSANRDSSVYDHPEQFDVDRWANGAPPHLTFGHGAHFCVGATLARMELTAATTALASRLTELRVSDVEMRPTTGIHGPARLVLDFKTRP